MEDKQSQTDKVEQINTVEATQKANNQNLNAALTYLVGWVTGLIFLLTEKNNDFIRFHAAQSLLIFGVLNLIAFIPMLGWLVSFLIGPIALILWVLLMVKAYQGERYKLPVVGDYAEQIKDKIGK